jgi:prophage regulatory protein
MVVRLSRGSSFNLQRDTDMSTNDFLAASDRFLRLPQVKALTGRSRSRIYDDPNFPKPIKLGIRESAWIESEVHAWMRERIEMARS